MIRRYLSTRSSLVSDEFPRVYQHPHPCQHRWSEARFKHLQASCCPVLRVPTIPLTAASAVLGCSCPGEGIEASNHYDTRHPTSLGPKHPQTTGRSGKIMWEGFDTFDYRRAGYFVMFSMPAPHTESRGRLGMA